jgi:predicted CXXCH cytochrome family protein
MAPPRSAFGASPPGGRRQRTGGAGSAASAWVRRALVGLLSVACVHVTAADAGRTPKPVIEPATQGTACVADPATMRREHMQMLKHQRDDTVHGGIRGAKFSLNGCIECHASSQSGSVARSETNFCVSCHTYAAVKIDCFGCHTSKPRAVAQQGAGK